MFSTRVQNSRKYTSLMRFWPIMAPDYRQNFLVMSERKWTLASRSPLSKERLVVNWLPRKQFLSRLFISLPNDRLWDTNPVLLTVEGAQFLILLKKEYLWIFSKMEVREERPFIIRHFTSITRIVGLFTSAGKFKLKLVDFIFCKYQQIASIAPNIM